MRKKTLIALSLGLTLLAACGKDEINYIDATQFDQIDNVSFDRTVTVTFSSSGVSVTGAPDDDFSYSVSGGGVTIVNDGGEAIRYELNGSTGDGYFKVYSYTTMAIVLNSVSITNPSGAAINVQGPSSKPSQGRRAYLVLNGSSTLADGTGYSTDSDEDEKGAVFAEGIIAISGSGSLTVTATGKSGIASDTYVHLISGTVTVNCSTGATVSNGDTLKPAAVKSQDSFIISGGSLQANATGTGAKGLSGDGTAVFRGGTVNVTASGSNFGSKAAKEGPGGGPGGGGDSGSSDGVSAKGIKFDGAITVSGGTVKVSASSHEAMESKSSITISGGEVYACSSSDDAINSAADFTITGGYVYAYAPNNDGLDANGDFYLNGGVVYAIGASSPEVAIDANTEESKQLYVNGGTLIALGGLESGAELNQSCYQASSWSTNTWYALKVGSTYYAFKTPASGGSGIVVSAASTPSLYSGGSTGSGDTYFDGLMVVGSGSYNGGSQVTLSSYSGGNSGGGNGPGH